MKYVVKVKGHKDTPGVVNEGRISMFPQNMKIAGAHFIFMAAVFSRCQISC